MTSSLRSAATPILLASCCVLLVVTRSPTQAKEPNQLRDMKVAVVDIGLLFQKSQRKDELERKINADRKILKQELEVDKKALIKLRKAFDEGPYRKGSDGWLKAREDLKLARTKWELKGERLQTILRNRVERNTLQILREIEKTVKTWGKAQGYDLILKVDGGGAAKADGNLTQHFQERIFRAQISDVLYHNADALDVTEAVLKTLNAPKRGR